MQETNYSAHAIEDSPAILKNVRKLCGNKWVSPYAAIYAKLKGAIKFRLPDNGVTLGLDPDSRAESLREFNRLPYPCIALEFTMTGSLGSGDTSCPERVLLCWETGDANWPISVQCFVRAGGKWTPYPALAELSPDSADLRITPNVPPEAIGYGIDEFRDGVIKDINHDLIPLSEFLAAVSCSNVEYQDCAPPEALNKKRRMRGRVPFFTYKTLVLKTASVVGMAGAGGTHAGPRVHLRRGHIRRLPDKRVWVNACVVGDKSKGMVVKDYAIQ